MYLESDIHRGSGALSARPCVMDATEHGHQTSLSLPSVAADHSTKGNMQRCVCSKGSAAQREEPLEVEMRRGEAGGGGGGGGLLVQGTSTSRKAAGVAPATDLASAEGWSEPCSRASSSLRRRTMSSRKRWLDRASTPASLPSARGKGRTPMST